MDDSVVASLGGALIVAVLATIALGLVSPKESEPDAIQISVDVTLDQQQPLNQEQIQYVIDMKDPSELRFDEAFFTTYADQIPAETTIAWIDAVAVPNGRSKAIVANYTPDQLPEEVVAYLSGPDFGLLTSAEWPLSDNAFGDLMTIPQWRWICGNPHLTATQSDRCSELGEPPDTP